MYAVSVCCRNGGTLEVEVSADGGDPIAAVLPCSSEPEFLPVGKIKLEVGAPVIKLEVGRVSGAPIFGLKFERVK